MNTIIFSSIVNFLHLFATVAWFGALTTNVFVLTPSIKKSLKPPEAGKLMGAIMIRFRVLVYTSIGVLILTGIELTGIGVSSKGLMQFRTPWQIVSSIKHIFIIIVVVLVIYAFEGLGRKVSRIAVRGPSQELASLQKRQVVFSYIGLAMAFIILVLTGILTAL